MNQKNITVSLVRSLETGNLMLDGGAMFGVVPKSLWSKVYPADENNLCNLSMRSLLVVSGNRRILIDTGIGSKQDEKFFSHLHLNGHASLIESLANEGFQPGDITDVLITHLHFDHCGGVIASGGRPQFPNARVWVGKAHWDLAMAPNIRERASFLEANMKPIEAEGKLNFIEQEGQLFPGISIRFYNGHTVGQVIPFIKYRQKTLVYVADLIPTTAHIPLAWVCGYDTQPLVSFREKEFFLKEALKKQYCLFFEHDIQGECCSLVMTEKGIRAGELKSLQESLK
jgi:glyoxylase-like metal-dependent hydrolase (beta-lactamase superfamily II)